MTTGKCNAALKAWEAYALERGMASRTRESYRQVLVRLATDGFPLTDPPEQVAVALHAYRGKLQSRLNAGEISRSYIRLHVAALRSFYRTLLDAELYPSDPTTGISSVASEETVPRPLTSQVVDRLFEAVANTKDTDNALRDWCMVWLYYHSLRNSEVAALKTSQISYSAREGSIVLTFKAKGGKDRTVVLVPEAGEALAELLLRRFAPADWAPAVEADDPDYLFKTLDLLLGRVLRDRSEPVFLHNGKPMTRRESNRLFQRYAEEAGVQAGPHSLRHTCATNLLEADVDLLVVSDILGHASIRQTQGYTKVLIGKKRRAMNRLVKPAVRRV
jgi:site-specific recombinase XerD